MDNLDPDLSKALDSIQKDAEVKLGPILNKHSTVDDSNKLAALVAILTADKDTSLPSALAQKVGPNINWDTVFSALETFPNRLYTSEGVVAAFSFLSAVESTQNARILSSFLTRQWSNPKLQVDTIAAAVNTPDEQLNLRNFNLKRILDPETFASAPPHINSIAGSISHHRFNYVEFVHGVMGALSRDPGIRQTVDTQPQIFLPELLLIGGVTIERPWAPALKSELSAQLDLFLHKRPPTSSFVFYALGLLDKMFLMGTLVDYFDADPALIGLILAAAYDANVLGDLLYMKHYGFTLELASHADKKNFYLFENFLKNSVHLHGFEFIYALLDYLEIRATAEYTQSESGKPPLGLNLRSVAASLALIGAVEMPQDRLEQVKAIQIQCLQLYPRLINYGHGHDAALLANGESNSFSEEVESEMKAYYQKMYAQQIEIRDIITLLQKLKQSDNPHDQDVFTCMVHSLFDEYRFFPEYPLSALATTAVLFGSLVYFQLIEGMPLSIALRYILDSLKNPPESNMFKFGLQALFEFRQRLHEFPKYCALLLEIPGLVAHQQFYQQIKDIVANAGGAGATTDPISRQPSVASSPNDFKSISANVPIDESTQEEPNESVSDKVLFIVNNIAQNNVSGKSKELSGVLDRKYYRWFANYIVGQRSKQEPNYHALYIQMLHNIGDRALEDMCIKVTYLHLIQLLNSPETATSTEKRNQLKHLGQWLGSLLLGEDKPILHKNIYFKGLLVEAYDSGRLAVVLPFVCKTLERASSSTVFLPPNPWLMGIMEVLAELYFHAELKLNLKFEIEVLCNQLQLNLNDIPVSTLVRSRPSHEVEQENLAREMQRLRVQDGVDGAGQSAQRGGEGFVNLVNAVDTSMYAALVEQFVFNGNTIFVTHPSLKRLLQLAADKAIREVLQPVVERSVTIASIATRELVTKDFAMEPDEEKMRLAAQNVIRVLAGNISLATCKEPLRESLATHLRNLVVTNGYGEQPLVVDQIIVAVNENVDLICAIVEKAAVEKSYAEVEEALLPAFMIRKHYRENNNGSVFIDPQLTTKYPLQLPDPFRLKAGGLLPEQFAIYENFGKRDSGAVAEIETAAAPVEEEAQPTQTLYEQIILQVQESIQALERAVAESSETSIEELSAEHKVSTILSDILSIATRTSFRDQIILKASQMIVSALFTAVDTQLGREVLCYLLDRLCEFSSNTAKEVVLWLIYSDDERKYNVPVMVTLINAKLITATEIDVNLSKQVLERVAPAVEFAAGFIYEAVLGKKPCALRTEFTGCLEAMEVISKEDPPNPIAEKLLKSLDRNIATRGPGVAGKEAKDGEITLKEQMRYIFAEWIRLIQHPLKTDRSCHIFVYQLAEHKILSNPEHFYLLVRTALEESIASYTAGVTLSNVNVSDLFVAVDALASLLITILKTTGKMELKSRVEYAKNLFTVITLLFAHEHDTLEEKFNTRPYFRLFSSMLYELSQAYDGSEFFQELYLLIANTFKTIHPTAFPTFSFAWTTLISHRLFMPNLLDLPNKKGWPVFAELLSYLIKFQGTYGTDKLFPGTIAVLYKGTLRIFLVILHDYPRFFIENHYTLCNAIPSSFVQLRNVVLSAFPENMELPDPLTQGLKVDRLPEIKESPILTIDPRKDLEQSGMKKLVDSYIKNPSQATLKSIASGFDLAKGHAELGLGYNTVNVNVATFHAFVLYVGMCAVSEETAGSTAGDSESLFNRDSPYLTLISKLLAELSVEGRYFFCEAMANQLRYPNRHTHFFSCVILSLFGTHGSNSLGDKKTVVQHLLTRVLLERIICNRPHPWGLMITFTELLKNPSYKFWDLPFTKTTPEIERMFASLYEHISSSGESEPVAASA
uniref:General negative regulator of transcription subunit 1 n=1 Tax=Blastobotrys adeninivorans TaxID=409370 RepID=A0A060T7L4_BLAAD